MNSQVTQQIETRKKASPESYFQYDWKEVLLYGHKGTLSGRSEMASR
ncbi:hypothetical protein [Brevibacillus laterosporus]|nr:hypothetical protein [Brevibacillus laterosporus]